MESDIGSGSRKHDPGLVSGPKSRVQVQKVHSHIGAQAFEARLQQRFQKYWICAKICVFVDVLGAKFRPVGASAPPQICMAVRKC